tara:strand:- start:343 stop:519 length:177 start_codon:yes stop_codon:yes gene_type:complete
MDEDKGQKALLTKSGKWSPLIGIALIIFNVVFPLALFRIPSVQKYLVAIGHKLHFDIP